MNPHLPMTVEKAAKQLERSERGQATCKLLYDFLRSNTVKFLDERNFEALTTLVAAYALGSSNDACNVTDALRGVIERNQWVNKQEVPS